MLTLDGPTRIPSLAKVKTPDEAHEALLSELEAMEVVRDGRPGSNADPRRLQVVRDMWARQYSKAEIVQRVARAFGVVAATVLHDVKRIERLHRLSLEASANEVATQIDAGFVAHTTRAFAEGNLKEARQGLVARGKLHGVFAPERSEHVNVNVHVNLTIDQVLDRIDDHETLLALSRVLEALDRASTPIDRTRVIDVGSPPLTMDTETDTDE